MTSGIAFFAYNTTQINYLHIAILAAMYVKKYMPSRKICLITDHGSLEWHKQNSGKDNTTEIFDDIIIVNADNTPNQRIHYDSPWYKFNSDFRNGDKHRIFDYSPYDKTLLLDIDYIVQNNSLDYVFESGNSITMFHKSETLVGNQLPHNMRYLNETGIPMVWSTAIYFDRNKELTPIFFDLWAHIAENYEFYRFLYGFDGSLFRTDFCVSIATHILNGMAIGSQIDDFPMPMIVMSQLDDISKINAVDEWVYLVNDQIEHWKDTMTLISKENVHVMNKRSIERNYDTIIPLLTKLGS